MAQQVRSLVDRQGLALTELKFTRDLGWIFREQPICDVGIDAIVEVVSEGVATGELLALQIKAGSSYLRSRSSKAISFHGDASHLHYWKGYAIPVFLIVCDPVEEKCWWHPVDAQGTEVTEGGFKANIPLSCELGVGSREPLLAFAKEWRSSRLLEIIREVIAQPLSLPMESSSPGRQVESWVQEMDDAAQSCLLWGLEVIRYYSCSRLSWIDSNMLLRGLLCSLEVLARWNPLAPEARLAKLGFVGEAVRCCAFHVAGVAGLDREAERMGLPVSYAYLVSVQRTA